MPPAQLPTSPVLLHGNPGTPDCGASYKTSLQTLKMNFFDHSGLRLVIKWGASKPSPPSAHFWDGRWGPEPSLTPGTDLSRVGFGKRGTALLLLQKDSKLRLKRTSYFRNSDIPQPCKPQWCLVAPNDWKWHNMRDLLKIRAAQEKPAVLTQDCNTENETILIWISPQS